MYAHEGKHRKNTVVTDWSCWVQTLDLAPIRVYDHRTLLFSITQLQSPHLQSKEHTPSHTILNFLPLKFLWGVRKPIYEIFSQHQAHYTNQNHLSLRNRFMSSCSFVTIFCPHKDTFPLYSMGKWEKREGGEGKMEGKTGKRRVRGREVGNRERERAPPLLLLF